MPLKSPDPELPRFHVDLPLTPGLEAALPPAAARHVQVLRLQPGAPITLFDGSGADWSAEVLAMGRSEVRVRLGEVQPVDNELPLAVTLAVGMPANERMDWLVEKATELGVATIQPLVCARSVLRLEGERADRKRAHWRGIATAAAEQCGRALVPEIAPVRSLNAWLRALRGDEAGGGREDRFVLSLAPGAQPWTTALGRLSAQASGPRRHWLLLSGPEGGLSPEEDALARSAGLQPVSLGPRVMRAETAPIAALAALGLLLTPAGASGTDTSASGP